MKYLVIAEVKDSETYAVLDCMFKGTKYECMEYIRQHKLVNPVIIPEDEY